ncbi:class I SAM-dependent methyltransferase [Estrella lausannensis]|uniref:S-adenosylmethionine-dependent methyltransferase domain-containing protein n=1 Tax=Estrella lausannensis TaxID=483423 RepID=A0A0H5DR90_9BACT|nr:class I SAM-dependent methyltransferase [Estrella lausannensis]CRX39201.1 Conserved hypothetical protein [Estrella lausannensis]
MMSHDFISLPLIADHEDKSSALKNRIRKNYRHVRKWANRTKTNCFRIYDRDIKEYPLAIDYYDGRFCVQYFSFNRDEDEAPEELVGEINGVLASIFGATPAIIYWRSRIRRKKLEQYEKQAEEQDFFTVLEYGVKFSVNLQDYLDTGLFLDHRETRQMAAALAKGKRLLNLFAYTGSFSVHAALAGAAFTKSVDLSNTYTQWTQNNFALNSISTKNHHIVRADCLRFLEDEVCSNNRYDVIVIDPPTISRSKKMEQMFDVQRDYAYLIECALKLLLPGGVILFSTNSRRFVFDSSYFPDCSIQEISQKTIPLDFHQKKIHRCWKLTAR